MASVSLALKVLCGASIASAGATGAYFLLRPTTLTKWDESVLETGTWAASEEDNSSKKSIKVSIGGTNQKINGSGDGKAWTWECKLTTNDSITTPKSMNITNQLSELKNKLGIDSSTNNDDSQRRKFVENCFRNRNESEKTNANKETIETANPISSTIVLKTEDKQGETDKLQFKNEDFLKLFKSNYENPKGDQ